MPAGRKNKILVIKLCCIGDIVQLTPALRALKEGGAEVHLLCVEWVRQIADMVQFIDKKHIVNFSSPLGAGLTLLKLIAERYDTVINFHRDRKSFLFASLLGAKIRAGFIWQGSEKSLTNAFPYDPKLHETERYLSIVKGLGFAAGTGFTQIQRPALDKPAFDMPSDRVKAGVFPGGGNNPGTVMPAKRWPLENFNKLVKLLEAKGMAVYVFGAAFDRKEIEAASAGTNAVKIESGLKEFAYYAGGMDLFVACDTGPLHIAAALGVKTIGLYGPSSPAIFGARGKNSVNIWEKTGCGPCYQPETVFERKFLECTSNKCMQNISVDRVLAEADKILGGKR